MPCSRRAVSRRWASVIRRHVYLLRCERQQEAENARKVSAAAGYGERRRCERERRVRQRREEVMSEQAAAQVLSALLQRAHVVQELICCLSCACRVRVHMASIERGEVRESAGAERQSRHAVEKARLVQWRARDAARACAGHWVITTSTSSSPSPPSL